MVKNAKYLKFLIQQRPKMYKFVAKHSKFFFFLCYVRNLKYKVFIRTYFSFNFFKKMILSYKLNLKELFLSFEYFLLFTQMHCSVCWVFNSTVGL